MLSRVALILCLLPLPAVAQDGAIGVWTCLTPDGSPAFAFEILDATHYADPSGIAGEAALPEPGVIRFVTGTWADSSGAFVPGIMALNLPGGQQPVICTAGG